jgi:hypothetical protein
MPLTAAYSCRSCYQAAAACLCRTLLLRQTTPAAFLTHVRCLLLVYRCLQELQAGRATVLVPQPAAALIRVWDVRWVKTSFMLP